MKKIERKKLSLSRETVRTLDASGLAAVKGALQLVGIVSSDNQDCTYSRNCDTW